MGPGAVPEKPSQPPQQRVPSVQKKEGSSPSSPINIDERVPLLSSKGANLKSKTVVPHSEGGKAERIVLRQLGFFLDGKKSAEKVLDLQQRLVQLPAEHAERKQLCQQIADEFTRLEGNYSEMFSLRQAIDAAGGAGMSQLFKLVYEDVDNETSHSILRSINSCFEKEEAKPGHGAIRFYTQIYTDVDDTLKPTLNDRQVGIEQPFYPGALELYQQLSRSEQAGGQDGAPLKVTVLSARPDALRNQWTRGLVQQFPPRSEIFCLFGSMEAAGKAIKHYAFVKAIVLSIANNLPECALKTWLLEEVFDASEFDTYLSFAAEKRQSIDRDLLLRPEARGMMVGDTGEGDLLFVLMKQMGSEGLEDSRIPPEYRGVDKHPAINVVQKPLGLSFAHAISSRSGSEYRNTPNVSLECRRDYEKQGTCIIDNFVDAALQCLQKGYLKQEEADTVVAEARKWLQGEEVGIRKALRKELGLEEDIARFKRMSNEEFHPQLEQLSPFLQYRLKLMRSIERYDAGKAP